MNNETTIQHYTYMQRINNEIIQNLNARERFRTTLQKGVPLDTMPTL